MVMVKCRKCGRQSDADKFVLDYVEKMMICPACVKERSIKTKPVPANMQKPKLPDDDDDMDFKEIRMTQRKEEPQPVAVKKIDAERVKYTCPKCGYSFNINIVTGRPKTCGYCETPIAKFKMDEEPTDFMDF